MPGGVFRWCLGGGGWCQEVFLGGSRCPGGGVFMPGGLFRGCSGGALVPGGVQGSWCQGEVGGGVGQGGPVLRVYFGGLWVSCCQGVIFLGEGGVLGFSRNWDEFGGALMLEGREEGGVQYLGGVCVLDLDLVCVLGGEGVSLGVGGGGGFVASWG